MADISKLKVGANSYDIKDTTARNYINYSNSEQVIGTWKNGHSIYRKIYELTISLDTNGYYVYMSDANTIKDIDVLVRCDYFVTNGTVIFPVPTTKSRTAQVYLQRSYGGLGLWVDTSASSEFNGKTATIILEYTKASDNT